MGPFARADARRRLAAASPTTYSTAGATYRAVDDLPWIVRAGIFTEDAFATRADAEAWGATQPDGYRLTFRYLADFGDDDADEVLVHVTRKA